MDCGYIKRGSSYNCSRPLQGGAEPNVHLINKKHVLGWTEGSTPNVITELIFEDGATSFSFEGFGRSVSPVQEVIALGSGQNLTKHQVGLFIFERSQEQKNNIQDLILGSFVAIVEGTQKDEDTFEVYGLNNGLVLQPGVINNLNENNGAYTIILATPANQGEAKLPQTFFDTDYPTTKDKINAYLHLPAIFNISDLAVAAAGGDAEIITGDGFFGGGAVSDVTNVSWINQNTLAVVNQTGLTVSSDTTITFNTVALVAGTYKLRVTTSKGIAYSLVNVVSS